MRLFKRDDLWDTLDDVGHYNGSIPRYSTWRSRRFGAIAMFIFITVGALIVGRYEWEEQDEIWKKAKINGPIYADSLFVADRSNIAITLSRKIRPLNGDDIKKLDLPKWKKLQLIEQIDTSPAHNAPVMIPANISLYKDDMFKNETACIGIILKRDSLTAEKPTSKLTTSPEKWFAVDPNPKIAKTDDEAFTLPDGYTFADEYFYISTDDQITWHEAVIFNNVEKRLAEGIIKIDTDKVVKTASTPMVSKKRGSKRALKKIKKRSHAQIYRA